MAYRSTVKSTIDTFLSHIGKTPLALRKAIIAWSEGKHVSNGQHEVSAVLQPYLTKVARSAYKITDEDVAQLKLSGYSEDEIYELTIAAALGASKTRLDKGLQLLQEAE